MGVDPREVEGEDPAPERSILRTDDICTEIEKTLCGGLVQNMLMGVDVVNADRDAGRWQKARKNSFNSFYNERSYVCTLYDNRTPQGGS